jgi:hypothetical protein
MRLNTWSYQSIPPTDKTGIPNEDDKEYFTKLFDREKMLKRIRDAKMRRIEAEIWLKEKPCQLCPSLPTPPKPPFSLKEFIRSNLP